MELFSLSFLEMAKRQVPVKQEGRIVPNVQAEIENAGNQKVLTRRHFEELEEPIRKAIRRTRGFQPLYPGIEIIRVKEGSVKNNGVEYESFQNVEAEREAQQKHIERQRRVFPHLPNHQVPSGMRMEEQFREMYPNSQNEKNTQSLYYEGNTQPIGGSKTRRRRRDSRRKSRRSRSRRS